MLSTKNHPKQTLPTIGHITPLCSHVIFLHSSLVATQRQEARRLIPPLFPDGSAGCLSCHADLTTPSSPPPVSPPLRGFALDVGMLTCPFSSRLRPESPGFSHAAHGAGLFRATVEFLETSVARSLTFIPSLNRPAPTPLCCRWQPCDSTSTNQAPRRNDLRSSPLRWPSVIPCSFQSRAAREHWRGEGTSVARSSVLLV